jgi:hypothetical protein
MLRIHEELLLSVSGTVAPRVRRREPTLSSAECVQAILTTRLLEEDIAEYYRSDLHMPRELER